MTDTSATSEESKTLQGRVVHSSDQDGLKDAIEQAFHYRGDVTITLSGESESVEGFVFDRRIATNEADSNLRLIPKGTDSHVTIPLSDIASISFTGKDTASGKSFDSWMKKYAQKKLAGEPANIESDPL